MSSDSLTYALEHNSEIEFKDYKRRLKDEWKISTKGCRAKNKIYDGEDVIIYILCKCTDEECTFETCFARFCNTIKC